MSSADDGGDDRVSVVVITHNRREELDRTLGLLAALPERVPVLVVDNASTDGTAAMVRDRHPDVTLLTPGANLGAVGRNLGVERARTPYVAFCGDDTWYDPGALRQAADLLDTHPRLAVITATILVEPGGRLDAICTEMAASPLEQPPGLPGHPLLSFLAGVSIVRRSAFLAAGGFSARLWLGGEEELLASDIARAGWHMSYVPEIVAHHQASSLRDAHLRRRHGIRNTLWFTWLRRPLGSAVGHTVRLLRTVPRDRVTVAGVVEALRGLPWVLRERDPVPPRLEHGYQVLEHMQLHGGARRYVSSAAIRMRRRG
jgi:N-acetylglucosaminyl-diphospho-decaprenol L-rhamnosyltransferase